MNSPNLSSYYLSQRLPFFIAACILVVIFALVVMPHDVLAQAVKTPQLKGNATIPNAIFQGAAGAASFTASSIGLVFGILWLAQWALAQLLILFGGALDFLFNINIEVVPASFAVVQVGWTALRDMANAFFILILVWIAITIILGVEKYGGKQLLFRAIAVALLINFSLAFVAAIFGFANIFAGEFYKKYPTETIEGKTVPATAAYIKNRLAADTFFTPMTPDDAKKMFAEAEKVIVPPQEAQGMASPDSHFAFDSALGVQKTEAVAPVLYFIGALGVRFGPTLLRGAASILAQTAAAAGTAWLINAGTKAVTGADLFTNAARLVLIDLFLLIAVACFAIICAMLIMRYVAVIFLSVVAPAAFLLHIIPGGYGDTYWKKWYTALFRWAFFLPAFVFLFYIALYFLDGYKVLVAANVKTNAALGGGFWLIAYLLGLAFMIASVIIARKIAGSTADIALGYTTKALTLGLGFAAGGAMMGVGAATRAAAPMIQKATGAVAARPWLGKVTAPLTRGVTSYVESQNAKVGAERKGIENWSDENLAQEARRSIGARKVAAAQILAERGKLSSKLEGAQISSILATATQFNAQMPFMKAAPSTVTPELAARSGISQQDISIKIQDERNAGRSINNQQAATLLIMEKVRPNESSNISTDEYRKAEVAEAAWKTYSASHISNLARQNPAAMQAMLDYLQRNPNAGQTIKGETYRYFQSNSARGLGLQLPDHVTPPADVQREQREQQRVDEGRKQRRYEQATEKVQDSEDRLATMRNRVQLLRTQGKTFEADNLNIDADRLEARIRQQGRKLQDTLEDNQ